MLWACHSNIILRMLIVQQTGDRISLTPSQDGIKLPSLMPALLASLYHDQLHPFIPFEAILVLRKQLCNLVIEQLVQPVHLSFLHLQPKLTLYSVILIQVHIMSQKYLLPSLPSALKLADLATHTHRTLLRLCCKAMCHAFGAYVNAVTHSKFK